MRFAIPLLLLFPTFPSRRRRRWSRPSSESSRSNGPRSGCWNRKPRTAASTLAPQDPKSDAAPKPMLRATNGAVRALKYLGFPLLNTEREKHAAFVLKCYDPKTGAFAEPGGKPDVAITSIGVMAAMELGIPKEKFAKAMDYLKENAKTFEEVRIAAAAVEAWGVKDCPFKLDEWFKIADQLSG